MSELAQNGYQIFALYLSEDLPQAKAAVCEAVRQIPYFKENAQLMFWENSQHLETLDLAGTLH